VSSILVTLLLSGCASQEMLAGDYGALQQEMAQAHARENCAPRDLALADANYDFVKLEFQQGNTRRAAEHLAIAREHARVAMACTPPPPPPEAVADVTLSDADADGVADRDDACQTEPEDLDGFRDVDGCPEFDNDGDGLADGVDACPNQAEDRDGVLDADGCPDGDNDADGVPDAADDCPNEKGAVEDHGCPSADGDHDGVPDRIDACAEAPETVNGYSDEDGCPDTKPSRVEITEEQIVIKQRINFATGKATILKDSFPVLDDVAQVMRDYPAVKIEIGGHTDNVGDEMVNQRLSKARADAVFEYLLTKGIPANRMITVGYGETRPIDTNSTDAGKLANRRVEFVISK
jgi:outer membrane protein OmpA-like peptidoglycan-associated protein